MLLIARRYLLSAKSHSVVNIIAGVSLVSLFLPVAAVIILLSVFNGFGQMVESLSGAVDGDLTVRLREGRIFETSDVRSLGEIEGVEAVSFIIDQSILVERGGRSSVMTVRGVDSTYRRVVPIEEFLSVGQFDLNESIVLGNTIASKLGIRNLNGASVKLYSIRSSLFENLLPQSSLATTDLALSGVLWLDQESEERYAFTSQEVVNKLIRRDGVATLVAIKLSDGEDLERVKTTIQEALGERFRVESRAELNPALYQIVRYEKRGILLICSFVILLASFTLIGALAMLIIEKRGDIESLRAMGMTHSGVRRIFMLEGMLITLVATLMGVVVGVSVTLAQQYFGIVELPTTSMVVNTYPVELQLSDVVQTAFISLSISLILCWLVTNKMLSKEDI